jgi:hypothetical protein
VGAADLDGALLCWYCGLLWLYCCVRSVPLFLELKSWFRLPVPAGRLDCEGRAAGCWPVEGLVSLVEGCWPVEGLVSRVEGCWPVEGLVSRVEGC